MRGMTQEQLAEKVGISRAHLSSIEAPGIARSFSIEVFFNIADALEVDPTELISVSALPDRIMKKTKKDL